MNNISPIIKAITNYPTLTTKEIPNLCVDSPAGYRRKKNIAAVRKIMAEECARYGVTENDVISTRRNSYLVVVRRLIAYRAKTDTSASYPEIGYVMQRDHTTILHHVQVKERMLAASAD